MSSIDERIVSMQFDNEQFEKNVGTTLKSLTNLEKSVDGLNGVNTSGISDAIESLQDRFSTLGIIGMTAIQNLTNRFVDAGIKMAKSLTVDQVFEGFDKYTANTKTVKALLNSTGETIDVVSEKINGLSWYSDATSYSYNSMVSALKSFTAQDIKMDEAIPAIMGIGNSLSYAGLAAEEASYAFDIYSKAMGQGYLANQHLRSLNNMGAVTAQWKQQMIDAAVAEGTLKKVGDGLYRTNQGLNVSLQEFDLTLGHQKGKWLTREVMMRVFGQVYGDYTSRLQAFMAEEENAGLTIDQAINKFNELNGITEDFGLKAFKSAQEARTFSEAVGAVRDAASSAWRGIFENVFGNAEEATKMWTSFSDWLYDVFMGPSEMMFNLTTEWSRLGGRDSMLQGFANLAEALDSFVQPIKQAFHAIFGELTASSLGQALKDLTDKFAKLTEKMKLNTPTLLNLRKIFEGFFSVVKIVKDILVEVGQAFGIVLDHLKPLGGRILEAAGSMGKWLTENRNFLSMKDGLITGLGELVGRFIDFVANAKPLQWIFEKLTEGASILWAKFKELGQQIKATLMPIADKNLNFENILKLIAAFGGAQFIKLTFFDRLKELGSLPKDIGSAISTALKAVSDSLKEYSLIDASAAQLKNIAMSLLIVSAALLLLASIDVDKLMASLGGMAVAIKIMESVLEKMSTLPGGLTSRGKLAESGFAMVEIAGAMLLIGEAMKVVGELDFEQIIKGIAGIGAVMFEMSAFIKSMKGIHVNTDGAFALILIATAMLIMSKGVEKVGEIPIETLKQGLTGIAVILGEISVFTRLLNGKTEGMLGSATSMVILGAAILVMAKGIEAIGNTPFETVMQGLVGIAAGLTVLGVALELIPSNIGAAASVGILSVSMIALAEAFKILGGMSFTQIGVGLAAIIPTLGSAFALFKLLNPVQTLAIAAALAVFAAAINLLIPPFLAFGAMGLENIVVSLIAIAGALGTLGLMSLALEGLAIPMLAVAGAMALFGVGVGAFAAGMATLATSGVASTAAFIGSMELWLTAIPQLTTSIVKAFTALLESLLKAIIMAVPVLLETLDVTITSILEFLIEKLPKFIEMGSDVVIAFLDGLAAKLPQMVESAINFIATFITSMANSLETHKDQLIEGIDKLIINIFDLVLGAIVGLLKMIGEHIPEIFKKGVELIGGFLGGIVEKGAEINQKMWEIIDKAGEAIAEKWEEVKQWGADIWNKIKEGFTNAINNVVDGAKSIGKNLLAGLGLGLDDPTSQSSLLTKAGGVARSILGKFKDVLGIASPSKETELLAEWMMKGFVVGIDATSFEAEEEAALAAEKILEAFGDPLAEMIDKLETEVDMNPTIKPVIDFSEFDVGLERMGNGLSMVQQIIEDVKNPDNSDSSKTLEKWQEDYKEWKKNGAKFEDLTHDIAFGSSSKTVNYGKGTVDMVAAAAHGMLDEEGRKYWNENATAADVERAVYMYQVTQNITSPTAVEEANIYRMFTSGMKDLTAKAAIENAHHYDYGYGKNILVES